MKKLNNKLYDVIVVGAGPAGLSVMLECAKKGLGILLIEESPLIESEKSWVTFSQALRDYPLLKKAVTNTVKRLMFFGPTKHFDTGCTKLKGHMIEQSLMNKAYQQELKKYNNCDILDKTIYKKSKREKGIVKVKTSNGAFQTKIIVDASGSDAVVSSDLGVPDRRPSLLMCYFLRIYKKKALNDYNCLAFSYGSHQSNLIGIMSALYPNSSEFFDIGIGNFLKMGESAKEMEVKIKKQLVNLWKFYQKHGLIKKGIKINFNQSFYGGIRVNRRRHIVGNNIVVVGDAAGQGSPITGEGLRTGLYYGQKAAKVIIKAIKKNDYSKKTLKEYARICKNKPLFGYGYGMMVQRAIRKGLVSDKPLQKLHKLHKKNNVFWEKHGLRIMRNDPLSKKEIMTTLIKFYLGK